MDWHAGYSGPFQLQSAAEGVSKELSHALGLRGIANDRGMKLDLRMQTDATAAMGMRRRLGAGKIRHVDAALLRVQSYVRSNEISLDKAADNLNSAGALTKYSSSAPPRTLGTHESIFGGRARGVSSTAYYSAHRSSE